jgi:predicted enzyme related to lactoylglutathione lyase
VKQNLGMVMVATNDIPALRRFYEDGLNWTPWVPPDENQAAYRLGSSVIFFLPAVYLAAESGIEITLAPKSLWAIFLSSKAEVDTGFAKAVAAGGRVTSGIRERDFDVYSGYIADPEGNGWELCYSPHMGPDETGALQFRG